MDSTFRIDRYQAMLKQFLCLIRRGLLCCKTSNLERVFPSGAEMQMEEAALTPCPVDGEWTPWSQWTNCTSSCGLLTHRRERQCVGMMYGGATCDGLTYENAECLDTIPCPGRDSNFASDPFSSTYNLSLSTTQGVTEQGNENNSHTITYPLLDIPTSTAYRLCSVCRCLQSSRKPQKWFYWPRCSKLSLHTQ